MIWLVHQYLTAALLCMPVAIVAMLRFLQDPTKPLAFGILIAIANFTLANLQAAGPAFIHRNAIGKGSELRLQVIMALFRKALRLRTWGCGEGVIPSFITSMSVDAERIYHLMHMGQWIVFQPVLFTATIVLLSFMVGSAAGVAGAVTLLCLCFGNSKLAQLIMQYRRRMQTRSARRILLTRQALDGIRAIKMYGWVEPVEERIARSRAEEERELAKYLMLRALTTTVAFIAPTALTFATLAVAALRGHTIAAESIFVVLALVNNLRGPMSGLPVVVGYLSDGLVSATRIGNLLALPEPAQSSHQTSTQTNTAVACQDAAAHADDIPVVELQAASFNWDGVPPPHIPAAPGEVLGRAPTGMLLDVNLKLKRGELCCVVGPVGGGKSGLLAAILGNMAHLGGVKHVRTPHSIAYCPQEPWIMSAELWQNVALSCDDHSQLDTVAYAHAVEASELKADIAQLPAGDRTEIGQHGINLSGGQRARVALARAMYQCEVAACDLVVLDDVLSAVDIGVARRLVKQCILGSVLRSRAQIVVLNSHYELLESAGCIVVMSDGCATVYESPAAYKLSRWAAVLAAAAAEGDEGSEKATLTTPATPLAEVPPWIAAGLPGDFDLAPTDAEGHCGGHLASQKTESCLPADGGVDDSGRLLVPEDKQVGVLSFATYRLYFGLGTGGSGAVCFFFVLLMIFIAEVLRIITDLWIAEWARAPIREDGESEGGNLFWIANFGLLSVCTLVFCFARSVLFMVFAKRASRRIHQRMLSRALRAPVNLYFDTVPTPQILSRLSKDLDVVDTMLPHYLLEFFQDFSFLFGTFMVVAWKAPLVLLSVPVCGYVFAKVRSCYMASSRELKRLEAVSRSPLLQLLSEAMEGISTLRALRVQAAFDRRFEWFAGQNGSIFWHVFVMTPWMISRVDGIGSVFVLTTAISLTLLRGMGSAVDGAVALTFILSWMGKLQWAMRQSIEAENYLTSVERCEHFERILQEREPADPKSSEALAAAAARAGVPAVEFESVSVRYRPRLPLVIKDLSFVVHPGERVGVIGRTGCGKSTLTLCLFRMLEVAAGEVRLHGVDVRKLPTTVLRRAIAVVPQMPLVYAGTLRENLDPLERVPDAELQRTLRLVELEALADPAKGGLDAALAEGGATISAGQRQLLTIARAALRSARVVVCDEATSSCDPKTDALVQRMLQGRGAGGQTPFEGAAMLTVAHRLNTLAAYDRVLLLSGPSAARGTDVSEIVRPCGPAVLGRAPPKAGQLPSTYSARPAAGLRRLLHPPAQAPTSGGRSFLWTCVCAG